MKNLTENTIFANNYLLEKQIGLGGFSEVWKAKDIQADLVVALKIYIHLDSEGQEQAREEFKKSFSLNHSNILTPSHFSIYNGQPFIVMYFCSGGTALKKAGEISEQELAKMIFEISSGIEYIHNLNPPLIHRDIKPDNFLINSEGNYLLADFGISNKLRKTLTKVIAANEEQMKDKGSVPNAYKAPELFNKNYEDRKPIKANDIFSFGVSLYEMTTGDFPFGILGGIALRQENIEIPNIPNTYSDGLNVLIKSCLSKETWDRPTASEIKNHAHFFLTHGHWKIKDKFSNESSLKNREKYIVTATVFVVILMFAAILIFDCFNFFHTTEKPFGGGDIILGDSTKKDSTKIKIPPIDTLGYKKKYTLPVLDTINNDPEKIGLRPIKIGNKWGYVNKNNQKGTGFKFDHAFEFRGGYAFVMINGKWGIIDGKCQFVIEPQGFWGTPQSGFKNGKARVVILSSNEEICINIKNQKIDCD